MKNFYLFMITLAFVPLAFTACDDSENKTETEATLSLSTEGYSAVSEGGDFSVGITSNSYWDISIADSVGIAATWITPEETSGSGNTEVSFTVKANTESVKRTAFITIATASGEASGVVKVMQAAADISNPVKPEGYSFPICEMLETDESHNLSNAVISGNKCTFTKGLVIERSGSDASLSFLCPAHTSPKANGWFQRAVTAVNWAAGDSWILAIPVKEDLSGDLRFCFGSRKDKMATSGEWTFEWSKDSTDWNAFSGTITAAVSDAMWKHIDFNIPDADKIQAGNKLYIKFTKTAEQATVAYFSHGICITKSSADKSSVPAMDNSDIVYSNGFDDLVAANAQYIEVPMGFMRSWTTGYSTKTGSNYVPADKYTTAVQCYGRPGYLQVSYADESVFSRDRAGSYTVNVGDRLKEMGYTKADLVLTFKAATIKNAYGENSLQDLTVSADGTSGAVVTGGEVGNSLEDGTFKTFTVKISGATQSTSITFGTVEKTDVEDYQKDYRFFLDDILIKTDGNTESNGSKGNGGVGDYGEGNNWK
ncbi:MAG: BACON domain-containing protein [Bacteroidales bacterium]|jgi:hypothetical protein|nr:BACON domain-containing protein [Bacteroidales bacterium]MCI1785081.1 BACON domain-containing protein [Bacteroidales bacterium]